MPSSLSANAGLALLSALSIFAASPATAAPVQSMPNIVLVHGAFADGSSWSGVIEALQRQGYHVTAVQNPLTSLADDVAATRRVLERQHGDVLLVGHSWGGAVMTEAGNAGNVKGIVYLSALVPDTGESVGKLLARLKAPMEGLQSDAHGLVWLDDAATYQQVMAADVPLAKVRQLAAVQQPMTAAAFDDAVTQAAWHRKPTWYLITDNDNALRPDVQRAIAKQIGATSSTIATSHLSLVAQPTEVAEFIARAARSIGAPSQ
ncbi:alpha/beta fold hydrolase [Xanthomonas oryzae]|uniref:alpha/beta fold hydrolase n=1 Tax=Xanthomonas oryzae TaxID=347 RepID=UPI0010344587|nr:alpha/beta hydrolase [Xanthomonas oryzae]QBH01222.1 alpha/beta hydrolase [Xanthomonas oryzae]